jgi:hypothetical protein
MESAPGGAVEFAETNERVNPAADGEKTGHDVFPRALPGRTISSGPYRRCYPRLISGSPPD